MLTQDIMPALQGVVPSKLITCAKDGTPNSTFISQVFYVGPDEVALSFQFFNKTIRNVRENPLAVARVYSAEDYSAWDIEVEFLRSETDGPVFEQMQMQLEAIASMSGMQDVFKLHASDVYKVLSVKKCTHLHK